MATRTETQYQVTRITRSIPKPYSQVIERLHSSIKQPNDAGFSILNHIQSKEAFEKATNSALGPHGFMLFQQFNHGPWMSLYGVNGGRQVSRIILGNPQIAITMLKHDISAGLFVPVEVLIIEREDGTGTDVIQVKPSTLIAGSEGSSGALRTAAEVLDAKLEKLWEYVAE